MRILSALAAIAMIASPAFAEHHSKVTKVNTVPAAAGTVLTFVTLE